MTDRPTVSLEEVRKWDERVIVNGAADMAVLCLCGRISDKCTCEKPCDGCVTMTKDEMVAIHGLSSSRIPMIASPAHVLQNEQ